MGRKGTLAISKDVQSRKWLVNICASLSKTGKRSRKKFNTKAEAENYRETLKEVITSHKLNQFDANLLHTSQYYNEAFQLYGFSNLAEACDAWIKELEIRNTSHTLLDLITYYKTSRGSQWSAGSIQTFQWCKKQLNPFHNKLFSQLDANHWQTWLPHWKQKGKYSARSFNHLRTFLVSLYSQPLASESCPINPIKAIPAMKPKKKEVSIIHNKEVKAILGTAWKQDRELVPWFAIALFAGLRPESELGRLRWEDINFEEKWIRVGFGNKTDTKRFVDLEDNLIQWLKPLAKPEGKIAVINHRKRKDSISKKILTWSRDITRHTYGSNLEAHMRAKGNDAKQKILDNMGHTMLSTYEQHYRNARTAKQATEFWSIVPPA